MCVIAVLVHIKQRLLHTQIVCHEWLESTTFESYNVSTALYIGENKDKCLESLDPYKLPKNKWVDDISKWPPIEYPDMYTYLIEAPGEFTLKGSCMIYTEFFKTVSPKLEDMFVSMFFLNY